MSEMPDTSSRRHGVPGFARHGRLPKRGPWGGVLRILGGAVAVIVASALCVSAVTVSQLAGAVAKNSVAINKNEPVAVPPTVGAYPGGFNVLIVGSDTRAGQGGIGGSDGGGDLNDVTMLLHVSGDHTNATVVSFPRDMVVPIASCAAGGGVYAPINTALSYGGSGADNPGKGLPCVVNTVEQLTGLKIQFAGLITFRGVIEMSNAVGGVPVCVVGDINDTEVGLHLKAGTHTIMGYTALKFLRSRHGVGDGSDLGRISSQQVFLSSLVRKLKSNDTLGNPATMFKIAQAATRNMDLSTSMATPDAMLAIAQSLRNVDLNRMIFAQYPGTTGGTGIYAGKVQPLTYAAEKLMSLIRADKPFTLAAQGNSVASTKDTSNHSTTPTATPTPTASGTATPTPTSTSTASPSKVAVVDGVLGQSASEYTCSVAYHF
ncbi:LCP family protein [Galbitalea soli]|uniref:LytR family transcriptional regulator n=1 Tax=Galbitalea soli TaxID=1268042 RepID=A0A7C9TTE2_9MICO|nr:LCP family protein [Galbitalea soli]NEM92541.1 LytR family transcriptional regulator [Galbitalea soli]NYJ29578.1 LCP family protein required for cell wall assembly [Galbitalea soli]